jgi:hypothetical protein
MATAPSHLKGEHYVVTGPYQLSVADSVNGLLYMPDASNPPSATAVGKLIVAAGNVYCGWLERGAKIGDKVSLIITGRGPAIASGAIAAYAAVTPDSAGKCKTGTVGTDHIIGFNDGPATTTDGDIFTLAKLA